MGFSDLADVFGLSAAAVGGAENFAACKYLSLVIKAVVVMLEFICETLTVYNNHQDLKTYKQDPLIFVQGDITIYNATVNVNGFQSAFYAFSALYAVEIIVSITLFYHQGRRIYNDEGTIPFLWIPVALFVELPLLISESYLLKYRGIIDWHDQKLDMVLHLVFIFNLPVQTIIDIWGVTDKSWKGFGIGIFLSPLCFILGCMIYTPISAILAGFHAFEKIKIEDFGDIKVTGDTKTIMLILANVGHIGQWIWSAIITIIVLYCICKTMGKKDDD